TECAGKNFLCRPCCNRGDCGRSDELPARHFFLSRHVCLPELCGSASRIIALCAVSVYSKLANKTYVPHELRLTLLDSVCLWAGAHASLRSFRLATLSAVDSSRHLGPVDLQ